MAVSVSREDALAELRTLFHALGLPDSLTTWAWDRIVLGKTDTEIMLEIEQTPEFKARFPGIEAARAANITPLSPAEYVAYEETAAEAARRYGLPGSFYQRGDPGFDSRLASAMGNGVSARQYVERLDNGYAKVALAPPEVREGFTRLYGVKGDAALATVYLDPANAQTELEQMAKAAEVAGYGDRFGLALTKDRSVQLATYGMSADELRQGYGTLADQAQLFGERINVNETQDLTPEEQGVDAVFNLSGPAREALKQRQEGRRALTAGTGGATQSEKGAGGLTTTR